MSRRKDNNFVYGMARGKKSRNNFRSGIALISIVGLLIAVYFIWVSSQSGSEVQTEVLVSTNVNKATAASSATFVDYTNEAYGFHLQYPENWTVTTDSSGEGPSAIFSVQLHGSSEGVTISVMPTSLDGVVRSSISVISETEIEVNGVTAQKLIGTNAKDGSEYTVVLITYNEKLYSISGGGQILDDVVSYFELI